MLAWMSAGSRSACCQDSFFQAVLTQIMPKRAKIQKIKIRTEVNSRAGENMLIYVPMGVRLHRSLLFEYRMINVNSGRLKINPNRLPMLQNLVGCCLVFEIDPLNRSKGFAQENRKKKSVSPNGMAQRTVNFECHSDIYSWTTRLVRHTLIKSIMSVVPTRTLKKWRDNFTEFLTRPSHLLMFIDPLLEALPLG